VFSAEPNSGDSEEISYLLEELELGNFDSIAVRGFPVKSRIVRENEVENFEEVKFSSTINEPVPPLAELNDAAAARRRAMEYAEKKFVEIQEFDRFENGKYIHDRVHPGFGNRRDLNEVKTETRDDRKGGFADTLDYATLKWIWKDAEEIFNQDNANDAVKLSEIKTNLETLQSQLNTIKEYQGIKRKGESCHLSFVCAKA